MFFFIFVSLNSGVGVYIKSNCFVLASEKVQNDVGATKLSA